MSDSVVSKKKYTTIIVVSIQASQIEARFWINAPSAVFLSLVLISQMYNIYSGLLNIQY